MMRTSRRQQNNLRKRQHTRRQEENGRVAEAKAMKPKEGEYMMMMR